VHVSFPGSDVPSALRYQPLFFCSSLLLKNKKISTDVLSPRSRFSNQTHKTSLHTTLSHRGSILSLPGLTEQWRRWKEE